MFALAGGDTGTWPALPHQASRLPGLKDFIAARPAAAPPAPGSPWAAPGRQTPALAAPWPCRDSSSIQRQSSSTSPPRGSGGTHSISCSRAQQQGCQVRKANAAVKWLVHERLSRAPTCRS